NVYVGQLLELVIHAGQLLLYMLRCLRDLFFDPGDVEKHSAVRAATSFADFAPYASRYVIAREQFGRTPRVLVALRVAPAFFFGVGGLVHIERRNILEHKPLAVFVAKNSALAA